MSDLTSPTRLPSYAPSAPKNLPSPYPSSARPPVPKTRPPPSSPTPADGTPPPDPPARIPHLGHAAALSRPHWPRSSCWPKLILLGFTHPPRVATAKSPLTSPPSSSSAAEAFSYIATLSVSWFLFPLLWHRPFAEGIQPNLAAARRNALRLIPIGLILSFAVQAISSLITMPKVDPHGRLLPYTVRCLARHRLRDPARAAL